MNGLFYDLHIHSCLSPCADNDMTPANIAGMAHIKGLQLIALTDHNTCRNAPALLEAAKQYGILALPGMELTTSEEIHVLFLFADLSAALDFDRYVYARLAPVKNREEFFGEQILMNSRDEVLGREELLLSNATSVSLEECEALAKAHDAVFIPAHLEKETTSLLSVLGMAPPDAAYSCIEINHPERTKDILKANPSLQNSRILTDSDAHSLGDIAEPLHTLPMSGEALTAEAVLSFLSGR